MRGRSDVQPRLFFTIDVESRIRSDHPLRDVKRRVDGILEGMSELFDQAYSKTGRPGVPPEQLLKALLLQALYTIRSETQLVERIDTDLLFRWFLDLDPADTVFDATAYAHNRPRLDEHRIIEAFFDAVVDQALAAGLCSDHFSVDGTIIESYASTKSFQPKEKLPQSGSDQDESGHGESLINRSDDNKPRHGESEPAAKSASTVGSDSNSFKPRNPEVDFHGQKRSKKLTVVGRIRRLLFETARLFRKGAGKPSRLAHLGHALAENRHGLIVDVTVTEAGGRAETDAAVELIDRFIEQHGRHPSTIGSDKGYDNGEYYLQLESRRITPHGAMTKIQPKPESASKSLRDKAQARARMKQRQETIEYELFQRYRKKVEECFGWMKCIGGLARSRHVGRWKIKQQLQLAAAAFNLVRLRKLIPT